MSQRRFTSLQSAPCQTEAPPNSEALLTAFLSTRSPDAAASSEAYSAAVRHFLHWLGLERIAIHALDDRILKRFEKHRCQCRRYASRQSAYKTSSVACVRRFVRFLEDQGYVDVADDMPNIGNHIANYSARIAEQQFAKGTAASYRSGAEHFTAWMRVSRSSWSSIDAELIEQYAHHDCRCPVYRKRGKMALTGIKQRRRRARSFIDFLQRQGTLVPVPTVAAIDPQMSAYLTWLKQHRGASDNTIIRYRNEITIFLGVLGAPSHWNACVLRSALAQRSKETPGSVSLLVTIMRSYLRFLIGQGECPPALLHAVPSVKRYRLSTLPRYVDPTTIEKIIANCGTRRPVEVRDKAIILLLARLGLRAGDIRDMQLDDIDWRTGSIRVKGKTRNSNRMPLPQDVGDAILAYLGTARPRSSDEHLFLRSLAPFTPFVSSAEIAGIVSRVLDRGGIKGIPSGSHIFRHSLATNMLRAGAALESVGTVLRHSSPASTLIYAKVDLPMLMKIAQPWPGDISC